MKNLIIFMLGLLLIIILILDWNHITLRMALHDVSTGEYSKGSYECGAYSLDASQALSGAGINSYIAIGEADNEYHAWVLVGVDPQTNRHVDVDTYPLIDVCTIGGECLRGGTDIEFKNYNK